MLTRGAAACSSARRSGSRCVPTRNACPARCKSSFSTGRPWLPGAPWESRPSSRRRPRSSR
eukprot:3874911-Lingulodinium_polyedra.AAC.1